LHCAVYDARERAPNLLRETPTPLKEATDMALINRVSRLFTADVHAVLDRIEEPGVLLKHALREMEEEVANAERHLLELEHEHARLADRQSKVHAALAELDEQVGVAFDSGNDALARKLIKRKLETARLDAHVTDRRTAVAKSIAERNAALHERREHLDVLRQKAELVVDAPRGAAADDWGKPDFSVGDDEVEVAYLRERQKRTRA
jgi:phage shock protein A